jgi:hypothetical protein
MTAPRYHELEQPAKEEGIELPRSAEEIIALEQEGHVVDLLNGSITENGADIPFNSPRLRHGFVETETARQTRLRWGESYPTLRPKELMPKGTETSKRNRRLSANRSR